MTVARLIELLRQYPMDAIVYVPLAMDGKNGTVQFVAVMPHEDVTIQGVEIPDDVALLPGEMEGFLMPVDAPDEFREGQS